MRLLLALLATPVLLAIALPSAAALEAPECPAPDADLLPTEETPCGGCSVNGRPGILIRTRIGDICVICPRPDLL